jgi:uncharacterized membrane protein YphA (DoxX/SURF4 family)
MNASPWPARARLVALLVVAAVFLFAGFAKLADPARFAVEIGNYRLLPPLVAGLVAVYLPWLEITLGLGLCVPRLRFAATAISAALLGVFCAALVGALLRGLDIRCGCFGGSGADAGLSAGQALARNLALIALLIASRPRTPPSG